LANVTLRDRDAIVTQENLIFRVFGYSHPPDAYVCDAEYAPASIFRSTNPKAFRSNGTEVFYKFYEDEAWKFLKRFPQYFLFHQMLQKKLIGVNLQRIAQTQKPGHVLRRLMERQESDELVEAMHSVLDTVTRSSSLTAKDFGVFGSLLHGFYNPHFSDIDLIIYGRRNTDELRKTLQELYGSSSTPFRNEFETDLSVREKNWRFLNFTREEYLRHQRKKLVYALFKDPKSSRTIKVEFEPVKNWDEIHSEYDDKTRVLQVGWVKMVARIVEDDDAPFIPSIYGIEPLNVLAGGREALEVKRIVSYVEEFRIQVNKDDIVYVEGNLEEIRGPKENSRQVTLTYCPRYYEQVLKSPCYS
jgi:predicted nucleotidyltransferase